MASNTDESHDYAITGIAEEKISNDVAGTHIFNNSSVGDFHKPQLVQRNGQQSSTENGQVNFNPGNFDVDEDSWAALYLVDADDRIRSPLKKPASRANDRESALSTQLRKHICPVCLKEFRNAYSVTRHMAIHQNEKKFTCDECGQGFQQQKQLNSHRMAQHEIQRCVHCDLACESREILLEHLKSHQTGKRVTCEQCGKLFKQSRDLKRHMMIHGEKACICTECGKCYGRVSELRKHVAIQHSNVGSPAARDGNELISLKVKPVQQQTLHNAGDMPFQCSQCNVCFRRKTHLQQHYLRDHGSESLNICEHCGMNFPGASFVQKHQQTCNVKQDKPFQCSQCTETFTEPMLLDAHMDKCRRLIKQHSCSVCNRKFVYVNNLKKHMELHVPPADCYYRCGECYMLFVQIEQLNEHMQTHSLTIACGECGDMFESQTSLMEHILEHSTELPEEKIKTELTFQCSDCGEAFLTQANLIEHQLSHRVGMRSDKDANSFIFQQVYICNECKAFFTTEEELKAHSKEHVRPLEEKPQLAPQQTKLNPFSCGVCGRTFKERRRIQFHMRFHCNP